MSNFPTADEAKTLTKKNKDSISTALLGRITDVIYDIAGKGECSATITLHLKEYIVAEDVVKILIDAGYKAKIEKNNSASASSFIEFSWG